MGMGLRPMRRREASKQSDRQEPRWQEALRRLKEARRVTIDVETSGLDFKRNFPVGYVLTFSEDPRDSYYLPVRHHLGGNIMNFTAPNNAREFDDLPMFIPEQHRHPIEGELIKSLDRQDLEVWGFHLNFDLKFLWRLGMTGLLPRFYDGYINAPLLDEYQAKFSLEFCCEQAGVQAKKSKLIIDYLCSKFSDAAADPKNAMGQFWRLRGDDAMAIEYAEGDGTSTEQLINWQNVKIREPLHWINRATGEDEDFGTLEKVHDIESRLLPVLVRMSCQGVRIDEGRLTHLIKHTENEIGRLLDEFPADFNPKSPIDVKKWCVDHGQTDWPFTPGRVGKDGKRTPQPSFPQKWLETHEPGKKIVKVRRLRTLHDNFLVPMRDDHLWHGRVHTSYHQLRGDEFGTVTGRLSSTDPNLQAVSKHDEEMGRLHRSIFIPDEGKIWANADYSQIEPRLLALYSDCKVLVEGFNAVPYVDAHTSASAAMNKNWPNMTPAERKKYRNDIGKRINQTLITGGGQGVLVSKYGVPRAEVDQAFRDYFRAMPEIKKLQKEAARNFAQRGWVLSLLGRRAHLRDHHLDYTAVNRLLQCGNADIIKLKMVQLDEFFASEGRVVEMVNNIHDDIAFQFEEKHRKVYEEALRIMVDFGPGQPIEIDVVPMAVDAGEGKSWSEATYGEEK